MTIQTGTVPDLRPDEALLALSDGKGELTTDGFTYTLHDDGTPTAENNKTGEVWFAAGDYGTPVTKDTDWVA